MSEYPTCARCENVIREGGHHAKELDGEGLDPESVEDCPYAGEWWECHGCASSTFEPGQRICTEPCELCDARLEEPAGPNQA